MADNDVDTFTVFDLGKDEWTVTSHFSAVSIHDREVCSNVFSQIGLVDHEQIRLSCARAAFARDLVSARDVDHIDRVIGEFTAEIRGQIVTARFQQDHLWLEVAGEIFDSQQVCCDVFANRGVWAAAGLDGSNAIWFESVVSHQEFGIFLCEDVVCDDGQTVIFTQTAAQGENQRTFSCPDRPADSDRKGPPRVVATCQWLRPFVKPTGMLQMLVVVTVIVIVRVVIGMVVAVIVWLHGFGDR